MLPPPAASAPAKPEPEQAEPYEDPLRPHGGTCLHHLRGAGSAGLLLFLFVACTPTGGIYPITRSIQGNRIHP